MVTAGEMTAEQMSRGSKWGEWILIGALSDAAVAGANRREVESELVTTFLRQFGIEEKRIRKLVERAQSTETPGARP
jgi:hypothetical protein